MSIRRNTSRASLLPMLGVAGRSRLGEVDPGRRELAEQFERTESLTGSVIERTRDTEGMDWTNCPAVCRNDEDFVKLAVELKRAEQSRGSVEYIARVKQRMRERWNHLVGIGNA